jgi:hypothetical protein
VKSLSLDNRGDLEAIVSALPPVTDLYMSGVTDEALAVLGRSRAAATVETLVLSGPFGRGDRFPAFPRLRALNMYAQLGDLCACNLATALPSLRQLVLGGGRASVLRVVARSLGPRLEELRMSLRDVSDEIDELELKACVTGDLVLYG